MLVDGRKSSTTYFITLRQTASPRAACAKDGLAEGLCRLEKINSGEDLRKPYQRLAAWRRREEIGAPLAVLAMAAPARKG